MSESNEKYCVTINDIETDQHNVIVRFSVGKSGRRSDFFFYTWQNVVYHTVHIRRLTQATELSLKINTLQDFANEKEFPVDITIEMKSLEPYEQIEIPDHGHYTDMTLSPLGLWIWDATIQGSELHESLPQHDIYLVFQDGSRMGYSAAEYEEKFSAGEELSWEADQVPYKEQTYISIVFQNKIDIHEVTAIEIDGEVIEVRK